MSNFENCAKAINDKIAASDYARFGRFNEEAAIILLSVAKECPAVSPVALAVTILNESVFNLAQTPNTNHHPEDPTRWDVGPSQINVTWTRRDVDARNVPAMNEREIFGALVSDGVPLPDAAFTGDPHANILMAARRIGAMHTTNYEGLGYQSPEEMRVVRYTGPGAQPFRLASYREYAPLFSAFFDCYRPD